MTHLNLLTIFRILFAFILSLFWPVYASANTPLPTQTIDENKCIVTETGVKVCPKTWGISRDTRNFPTTKDTGRCLLSLRVMPDGSVQSTKMHYSRFQTNYPSIRICRRTALKWAFEPTNLNGPTEIMAQLFFKPQRADKPSTLTYGLYVSFTDFETSLNHEPKSQFVIRYSVGYLPSGRKF